MAGAFFETWVVGEIIKSYYNAGKRPPLYYYRDKDNREIDLIILENNKLHPVEIKKSSNPGREAIRYFNILQNTGLEIGEAASYACPGILCLLIRIIGTYPPGSSSSQSSIFHTKYLYLLKIVITL